MSLHLQCRTQDEIAKAVGLSQDRIAQVLREIADLQKAIKPLGPKDAVTHGQWLPWLKKEFEFSREAARRWMRCYEDREKLHTMCNLAPTAAYKLLASPDAVTDETERRLGEILEAAPKNRGAIPGKTGIKSKPVLDPTPTIRELNIPKATSARTRFLAVIAARMANIEHGQVGRHHEVQSGKFAGLITQPDVSERKMGQMLKETERAKGAMGNPGGRGAKLVRSQDVTAQPTLLTLGLTKRESAERKMGQMLKETERAKGMRAIGGDKRSGGTVTLPPEDAPTLSALGLTKRESAERKMGQMLKETERAKGVKCQLKGKNASGGHRTLPPEDDAPTLSALGLTKRESAERKMGQMLKETERADGGDAQRTRLRHVTESPPTLSALGLTKRESAERKMLAALSEATRTRSLSFDAATGILAQRKGIVVRRHTPPAVTRVLNATQFRGARRTVLCV